MKTIEDLHEEFGGCPNGEGCPLCDTEWQNPEYREPEQLEMDLKCTH